jgi:amino acid adenylation domain-containing protein
MNIDEKEDGTIYKLIVNHGEQYSIWPAAKENPRGWKDVEKSGTKAECLAYIKYLWTNMRPLNLRTSVEMAVHSQPHRSDSSLPPEIDRDELVAERNNTRVDYPGDICVHGLFEAQVKRTPDAIAMTFGNQQLTYRELNARANQLAHYLQKCGVGPDMLVGICVERSLEMVVGILGILKAGGAYVPLDPAYPKERLAFLLEDAQVSVLLTQAPVAIGLPVYRRRVVCLDTDWPAISRQKEESASSNASAENLAYVMYTSGSTGKPKGVMISHSSLCHYVHAMRGPMDITAADVYLHTASIAFSSSVRQLMLPMMHGARVVIATTNKIREPVALFEMIKAQGVTIIDIVPSYWRNCVNALASLEVATRNALLDNHLRLILAASEPLMSDLPRKWAFELKHGAKLINMFGQTETTGIVTVHPIPAKYEDKVKIVPIGRAIANTQMYILDSKLQPVPRGVSGELHIAGLSLARGYLNRPDLTAEKFIANPFSDQPGSRFYKTGDRARVLSDGTIEFLGRIDHQVKIRGIRVELEEVEGALRQHPSVGEAVVVAQEVTPDEKCLVAYLVSSQQPAPAIRELRTFLKRRLPDHMVPSAFVLIEALPHTPNGKVDRRALSVLAEARGKLIGNNDPEMLLIKGQNIGDRLLSAFPAKPATSYPYKPKHQRLELETPYVAPRTEVENTIARIWQEVLGLNRIGIHDNFFELGGHSMSAARLCVRLHKELGRNVTLSTLFRASTVEDLARVLCDEGSANNGSSIVALQTSGSRPPFFCVPVGLGSVHVELGEIARLLGPDQPFYGLQNLVEHPTRVEARAARYVEEIRSMQPEGPYLLGGICLGGVVAFEIALQLVTQGAEVPLLALIEPGWPLTQSLRARLCFAASMAVRMVRTSGYYLRGVLGRASVERSSYAHLLTKALCDTWAFRQYVARTYPADIVLFLAERSIGESRGYCRVAWPELVAGAVETHLIPGRRETITRAVGCVPEESQLRVLAGKLRTCIDDVLRKGAGGLCRTR